MKATLIFISILLCCGLYAQQPVLYKGKMGLSTIEFEHVPYPGSSTAKIITREKVEVYNFCSEEVAPKVQKLCWYSEKSGFNIKKNIKINAPAKSKKLSKTLTGTYNVNGVPVKFTLIKSS